MMLSRFPMGGGKSKYAEGSVTYSNNTQAYSIVVSDLGFTPKVVFGSVLTASNAYSDNHLTTAMLNDDGTTTKLQASANGYSSNPAYEITENGFVVSGATPPANYQNFNGAYATLTYKAWG